MWSWIRSALSSVSSRKSNVWGRRPRRAIEHRPESHVCVMETLEDRRVLVTVTITTTGDVMESGGEYFVISTGEYLSNSVTVYFTVTGSATEDADYEDLGSSVVLPPNTPSVQIAVQAVMDNEFEPDEFVIVTLDADAAYTVGNPGSATMKIQHCNGYMQGPRDIPQTCPDCATTFLSDTINGSNNKSLTGTRGHAPPPLATGVASGFAAPGFSSHPVRYADGVVMVASRDLESEGMGVAWGVTRSWTNGQTFTAPARINTSSSATRSPSAASIWWTTNTSRAISRRRHSCMTT
jgi:hypothetical protein